MAENKKEPFTFSDKIKNSKPAFNPFSKRVSSKIGSNGKPKKTIFERTKRDAPFFIAALAALLMLPFLYKYSGNIDEGIIIPPGSEDSVFDPERFGFDPSVEDPAGQIAQYTGRDSISLIKGFGGGEEDVPSDAEIEDWRVQDGLDDNYNSTPSAPARSYAPAATRAAFQRTPTKINELGDASLNLRGGGGQGFRFGGERLKAAARQDSSGGPRMGIKPVSLQPLRAADSPSRSYFGQGGAAQARASRAAMGKSNALQALNDALFNPVRSGGVSGGGLGSGAFGNPGGGGQITHTLDYKGITPWWWDMMKERSQKAWEWKYFLWRKNLVEPLIKALAEVAATFGKGLACCILTGEDDCSMGSMWGTSGDSYSPAVCKCKGLGNFDSVEALTAALNPGSPLGKDAKLKDMCNPDKNPKAKEYGCSYEDAKGGGGELGFFGKRAYCLGATVKGNRNNGEPLMADRFGCQALDTTHNFELQTSGKANKWHQYHAVIAKNYVPFDNDGTRYLCGGGDRNVNRQSAAGLDSIPLGEVSAGAQQTVSKNTQGVTDKGLYNEGLVRDDVNDSCVIYVAEGGVFDWDNFKSKTMAMLSQLNLTKNGQPVSAEEAFGALNLYFIEGYAFEQKMSKGANEATTQKLKRNGKYKTVKVKNMPVDELPLKYVDFETYYVLHKGNTSKDKESFKDSERIFAKSSQAFGADGKRRDAQLPGGKANAIRGYCAFSTFRITAVPIDSVDVLEADLTFDPGVHGKNAGGIRVTLNVPETGLSVSGLKPVAVSSGTAHFVFKPSGEQLAALNSRVESGEITAKWRADFQNKLSTDEETYSAGITVTIEPPPTGECSPGDTQTKTGEDGCEYQRTCQDNRLWGNWTKTDPNCGNPQAAEKVDFFGRIQYIMKEPQWRLDMNWRLNSKGNNPSRPGTSSFGLCEEMSLVEKRELLTVDDDTLQLFQQAKSIYDNAHKQDGSTLVIPDNRATVANLLDAMDIVAAGNDNAQIPLNAVCMLGKTIGVGSRDPQIKNANNMFGTFAAYMGPESSFFPAQMRAPEGEESKAQEDLRFKGCQTGSQTIKGMRPYHYGHYNWNHEELGDLKPTGNTAYDRAHGTLQNDRQPFEQELQLGPWRDFPLKPIAEAVGWVRASEWDRSEGAIQPSQSMDQQNRRSYKKAYHNVLSTSGSCGLRGTMSYGQVKLYIQALCQDGALSAKPTNGDQIPCGSRYLADTTNMTPSY